MNINNIKPNNKGIQSGAVIHHQDQSINFVSFNTRNTINNMVPMLVPLLLDFDMIYLFILLRFNFEIPSFIAKSYALFVLSLPSKSTW